MDLLEELVDLRARNMAQRQIIIRLLAYLAKSKADPEGLLREFSSAADEMAADLNAMTAPGIEIAEKIRRETDYLLTSARKIALE